MNSHTDIQKRLAAYCSGDVDTREQLNIEAHLASCPRCRADLQDLKTALKLVKSIPDVEPPSWMKSRIMARLQGEQEQKRSWLQRFWFPLHAAMPVKALALLIVCVSGYYLSRSVDTELQLASRQKLQEAPALQEQKQAPAPPPDSASMQKKTEPPATRIPQQPLQPSPPPQPEPRQEAPAPQATSPAPAASAPAPFAAAPPALKDQYAGKAESSKALSAAESANTTQEATLEKKAKSARRTEPGGDFATPPAAGRAQNVPAAAAFPVMSVRLILHDPSSAVTSVREAAILSGGTITDDRGVGAQRIKVRIPADRQKELFERLQRLGRIVEKPAVPPSGAQFIDITVQW